MMPAGDSTAEGPAKPSRSGGSRSFILTYHSLDESGSPISVPPAVFQRQMEFLSGCGMPVVPLGGIRNRPGAVAITFDDGFDNFLTGALPALQKFRLPATVFAVSGYCGRRNDWPTQAPGIPILPLMDWAALRELSRQGIEIGAHTIHHPRLTHLSAGEMEREVSGCQKEIEDRIGKPVRSFAYPYGDSNAETRQIASRHFDAACGVRLGYLESASGPFDLPRLDAYYLREPFWFERLGTPAGWTYIWARRQLRWVRAALLR